MGEEEKTKERGLSLFKVVFLQPYCICQMDPLNFPFLLSQVRDFLFILYYPYVDPNTFRFDGNISVLILSNFYFHLSLKFEMSI